MTTAITLGVEEEFFLIDPESRNLLADPDPRIFKACEANAAPHKVVHEFLRSQIETNTKVCSSVAEVRQSLKESRRLVIEAAERYGAQLMAASVHPFAAWQEQMPTPKDRYERFATTYQESVQRLVAGGMHVHAGFGDEDSRIRIMTALRRHLPVLNALSGSSPFNAGRETGFKSSRLNLFGALPRSGLPEAMRTRAEYDNLVWHYKRMELIADGSELWWNIRPSQAYPTVELRICDVCPRIDDAVCIAALYACLIRRLERQEREGHLPPDPPTEIIAENRWLAQRYGVLGFLGDTRQGGRIDIADEVAILVDELTADAKALECEPELRHALNIIREGASADRQLDHYRLCILEGATEPEALSAVVDLVVAETRADI